MIEAPQRIPAWIEDVSPLGAQVLSVRIDLTRMPVGVRAGHYVMLHHPDGTGIPFSLASPPRELPQLTLHYRATGGSDDARLVEEVLGAGGEVTVSLPYGHCGLASPLERPLLIVAGGTGITQVRSILLEHLPTTSVPIRLYWGVLREEDLYLADELDELARTCEPFDWFAAVESGAPVARPGSHPRAADLVIAHIDSGAVTLDDWDVLLAGGPPMVWGTVEQLRSSGLTEARTCADVFEYAPRDDLWG